MSFPLGSIRIVVALTGFFATLTLPPWVVLVIMLLLALRYFAWETLTIGIYMDFMWQPFLTPAPFPFFAPIFSLTALLLLWGLEPLRREFMVT